MIKFLLTKAEQGVFSAKEKNVLQKMPRENTNMNAVMNQCV